MTFEGIAKLAVLSAVALELFLLISGYRILVHQKLVHPGEHYLAGEWGDLGDNGQASLACTYFTGRSFNLNVIWYAAGNFMGMDQCPFVFKP